MGAAAGQLVGGVASQALGGGGGSQAQSSSQSTNEQFGFQRTAEFAPSPAAFAQSSIIQQNAFNKATESLLKQFGLAGSQLEPFRLRAEQATDALALLSGLPGRPQTLHPSTQAAMNAAREAFTTAENLEQAVGGTPYEGLRLEGQALAPVVNEFLVSDARFNPPTRPEERAVYDRIVSTFENLKGGINNIRDAQGQLNKQLDQMRSQHDAELRQKFPLAYGERPKELKFGKGVAGTVALNAEIDQQTRARDLAQEHFEADLERRRSQVGGVHVQFPGGQVGSIKTFARHEFGNIFKDPNLQSGFRPGEGPPPLSPEQRASEIEGFISQLPGYQFRLSQGTQALERSASAKGMLRSGALTQELQQFGQNLASAEFGAVQDRLAQIAGIGMAPLQQSASLLGTLGQTLFAGNVGLGGILGQNVTEASRRFVVSPFLSQQVGFSQMTQQSSSSSRSGGGFGGLGGGGGGSSGGGGTGGAIFPSLTGR